MAFTGHTHYMLTDDRTVWQGAFTCINTGAMLTQAPGRECDQFVVSFPTVKAKDGRPRAYEYRVSAHASDGTVLAETKVYSPFINCAESHEPATSFCVMEKTALLAERCVRFMVEPLDCWGDAGRGMEAERPRY